MHANICFLPVAIVLISAAASAQEIAPLPKTLKGHWTAIIPGGRTYTDVMSIVLDDAATGGGTGSVTGRLTVRGVTCGAENEPIAGTWNGSELRLESLVHPNVNAQRPNADCGSGKITFILMRNPGQGTFEGESRRDGSPVPAQIELAP